MDLPESLARQVRFVSAVARRLRILGAGTSGDLDDDAVGSRSLLIAQAMMRGDRNSAHGAVQSLANFDIQNRDLDWPLFWATLKSSGHVNKP